MRTILFLLFCASTSVQAGELGDLLQDVLSHPAVMAAKDAENAARSRMDAATGRYFGSATLSSGWHRFEGPRIVGVFVPGTPPLLSDKIIQTGVSYSIPVDLFGAISANRERAKSDLKAAEFSERQQVLFKLHQIAMAYLTLQSLENQKAALELYRKRVDLTLKRIETAVELGRAARVDALYATSEAARAAADEGMLASQIEKTQADLLEASGRGGFLPASSEIRIPTWEKMDPAATLPAMIADSRMAAARAGSKEAKAAILPSVSLDASYYNNATPSNLVRDIWQVGGVISVPIGAVQFSQYEAQKSEERAAEEEKAAVLRESARQISELKTAYDAAMNDARAMQREVAYRARIVAVQREMQQLGSQTLENLFTHEHDLLDAKTRLHEARARAAIAWSAAQVLNGMPSAVYISKMDTP